MQVLLIILVVLAVILDRTTKLALARINAGQDR